MLRHAFTTPLLALALCPALPAGAADYVLRKIANDGQLAPGTPGASFAQIPWPQVGLNAAGEVALRAGIASDPEGSGVWVETAGALHLRMRDGDPAPATGGIYAGIPGDPVLDAAGNVTAAVEITGGTTASGLFRDTGGSDSALLLDGQPAPPGVDGTLRGVANWAQTNAAGAVVFAAAIDPNLGEGVFVREANGTLRTVVRTDDPLPGGGQVIYLDSPQIDPAGRTAFEATLTIGNWTYGLFAETPGGLARLALSGDVAPDSGGSTFESFQPIAYNGDGSVLFWAHLDGPIEFAAFLADTSGVTAVTVPADELAQIAGVPSSGTNILHAQHDGSLLVHASFTGGAFDNGLFVRHAGEASLHTVAKSGDVAPGTSGAHFYGFYDVTRSETGEIAFVGLHDAGWAAYVASPAPQVPALPHAWGALAALAILCASRARWRRTSRAG
jgi:hypothetical protein